MMNPEASIEITTDTLPHNLETISLNDDDDDNNSHAATQSVDAATIEEIVEEQSKREFYTRCVVGLVFFAFVVFVIVDSATNMHALGAVHEFLEWVEQNPVSGVFAFVIVYFVATVLFIPGALLTLGAGFVFAMAFGLGAGVVLGTLAVFFGASIGATVSFLLGRYLLRRQMHKLTNKYAIFEALEAALVKKGLRIFVLLRLSPIIPFSLLNYIAGITSVSLKDYVIALFAILPGTILYVFLGASAGSLAESATSGDNATLTIVITVVGAVFGILAIAVTSRYAKAELNRVLEERRLADEIEQAEADLQEGGNTDKKSSKPVMQDESHTQIMDGSATEFGDYNNGGSDEGSNGPTLMSIQEDSIAATRTDAAPAPPMNADFNC